MVRPAVAVALFLALGAPNARGAATYPEPAPSGPPERWSVEPGVSPERIRQWRIEATRLLEGDISLFRTARPFLEEFPRAFHPGRTIELTYVDIAKQDRLLRKRTVTAREGIPAQFARVTHAPNGDVRFWLHPDTLGWFFDRYPRFRGRPRGRGKGVVQSSFRTVYLHEVDGRPLAEPLEIKASLNREILGHNRLIESRWIVEEVTHPHRIPKGRVADGIFGAWLSVSAEGDLGWYARRLSGSGRPGTVRLEIPYFALFAHPSGPDVNLLGRMYRGARRTDPSLKAHDFAAGLVENVWKFSFDAIHKERLFPRDPHLQNAKLLVDIPAGAADPGRPLAWAERGAFRIEGALLRDPNIVPLAELNLPNRVSRWFAVNVWRNYAGNLNWAASIPGFDRRAFHRRLGRFLERRMPPAEPPSRALSPEAWRHYRTLFDAARAGLAGPAGELGAETAIRYNGRPLGGLFPAGAGESLGMDGVAGLKANGDPALFAVSHDRIALKMLSDPRADVAALVRQENALYELFRRKAKAAGVRPSDRPAYLRLAGEVFHQEIELARLRRALRPILERAALDGAARERLVTELPELFRRRWRAFEAQAEKARPGRPAPETPRLGSLLAEVIRQGGRTGHALAALENRSAKGVDRGPARLNVGPRSGRELGRAMKEWVRQGTPTGRAFALGQALGKELGEPSAKRGTGTAQVVMGVLAAEILSRMALEKRWHPDILDDVYREATSPATAGDFWGRQISFMAGLPMVERRAASGGAQTGALARAGRRGVGFFVLMGAVHEAFNPESALRRWVRHESDAERFPAADVARDLLLVGQTTAANVMAAAVLGRIPDGVAAAAIRRASTAVGKELRVGVSHGLAGEVEPAAARLLSGRALSAHAAAELGAAARLARLNRLAVHPLTFALTIGATFAVEKDFSRMLGAARDWTRRAYAEYGMRGEEFAFAVGAGEKGPPALEELFRSRDAEVLRHLNEPIEFQAGRIPERMGRARSALAETAPAGCRPPRESKKRSARLGAALEQLEGALAQYVLAVSESARNARAAIEDEARAHRRDRIPYLLHALAGAEPEPRRAIRSALATLRRRLSLLRMADAAVALWPREARVFAGDLRGMVAAMRREGAKLAEPRCP